MPVPWIEAGKAEASGYDYSAQCGPFSWVGLVSSDGQGVAQL